MVLGAAVPAVASAQLFPVKTWEKISDPGMVILFIAAPVVTALADGDEGVDHAGRTLDALAVSYFGSEGLKRVFRQKRPNSNKRDSFPSTAAAASFAIATTQAAFRPKSQWIWWTAAGLITHSRMVLGKHYTHDLMAGAAFGYAVGRLAVTLPDGIILTPIFNQEGMGASLALRF